MLSKNIFDIVIAGAGPAGSTTALLLAKAGFSVCMIDKSSFDDYRPGESLSPGVKPLLMKLGLWQPFLQLNPLPCYGTHSIWGSPGLQEHSHLFTAYQNGWHINRRAFDSMIISEAEKCGVSFFSSTSIVSFSGNKWQGFDLRLVNQTGVINITTKFLVDASGRNAVIASRLNAKRIVFDRLIAIASQTNHETLDCSGYTFVEAVPQGWWYTAPLTKNQTAIMFMTDGDLCTEYRKDPLDQWRHELNQTQLSKNVSDHHDFHKPKYFSAVSQRVIRDINDHRPWLSVGDSCLSVDPISGSGVIRALGTAIHASETVSEFLKGDLNAFSEYENKINKECINYLLELGDYYNIESRWQNQPFWQRRSIGLKQYAQEIRNTTEINAILAV